MKGEKDSTDTGVSKFILLSKQSGDKIKEIINPHDNIVEQYFSEGERSVLMDSIMNSGYFPQFIIKDAHSFLYNEYWSDTIFEFTNDMNGKAPAIAKRPSQSKF